MMWVYSFAGGGVTLAKSIAALFRLRVWAVCSLLLPVGLAACSPTFNWREVPNSTIGFIATYPDKPVAASREMNLDGLTVPLTLEAVKIESLYFSVGTVPLNAELEANQERLKQALAQALANNVRGGQAQLQAKNWAGQQADYLQVKGRLPGGQAATVQAYYVVKNKHLIQLVLMGPDSEISDLVTVPWFRGFRFLGA